MTARRLISRLGRVASGIALATLLAVALASAAPSAAWAQSGKEPEKKEPETRGLTMPYFFVGVAVLLVVAPVCWPALRRWDLPFHGEEV